ncbi:hypothetical protein, partial [Campylobacter sp.]|uniref:hypothetical protein n=1 Tax=Campylobacter sp. TaxID=205 RepID=UPI0026DABC5A
GNGWRVEFSGVAVGWRGIGPARLQTPRRVRRRGRLEGRRTPRRVEFRAVSEERRKEARVGGWAEFSG